MYRDSIMLEAERQKATFGYMEDWAAEFSQLVEDDAVATFIQVSSCAIYNDAFCFLNDLTC